MIKVILLFAVVTSFSALGHESHRKDNSHGALRDIREQESHQKALSEINETYIRNVRPIFKNKCFDCHSNETTYPWYYKLPGAKQLIDSDVEEAKQHLDMSKDFPFLGHGSPQEDLEAIEKVAKENSMPPFRYWIVNWDKGLNQDDRKMIREWTGTSIKLLQEATKPSENSNLSEKRDTKK